MKTKDIIAAAKNEGRSLLEHEAYQLLKEHDIPVPEYRTAVTEGELLTACKEIGYPVVLKIISPQVVHKSDANAVILNVNTAQEAEDGYLDLMTAMDEADQDIDVRGVLVSKMMPEGREVIIGMTRDPQFGPALLFGLGGVFVEVLKDIAYRVAPVSEKDAGDMIGEINGYPLLKGVRNTPPSDIESLKTIIKKISILSLESPDIAELDLNPVLVYQRGAYVVDARIMLYPAKGGS